MDRKVQCSTALGVVFVVRGVVIKVNVSLAV